MAFFVGLRQPLTVFLYIIYIYIYIYTPVYIHISVLMTLFIKLNCSILLPEKELSGQEIQHQNGGHILPFFEHEVALS